MAQLSIPNEIKANDPIIAEPLQENFQAVAQWAAGSIGADNIADGSITSDKLAAKSVTSDKVAAPVRTNISLASSVTTSYAYVDVHNGRAHLYLNFLVNGTTLSAPYDLVTLPAALRPSMLVYVTGATNAGLAVILAIRQEGQIRVMAPSIPPTAHVSLSASWAL